MIDLEKQSGLPISWDRTNKRIIFPENFVQVEPVVRVRKDMEPVLFEPEEEGPQEFYYIYRGVAPASEAEEIARRGLRYDISVLRPGTTGREFVKTFGHYHSQKPGTEFTYPEVYEVLYGRVHFMMQLPRDGNYSELEKVLLISAKPGDKVLIPPNFGHVTINPGEDCLILSNWVADDCESHYQPIQERGGGAYFELQDEEGPIFLTNTQYSHLPALKRCSVTPVPRFNLHTGLPIYRVLHKHPESLSFLVNPENYQEIFQEYLQGLLQAGKCS